jgi:hypothetical protein
MSVAASNELERMALTVDHLGDVVSIQAPGG